MPLNKKGKKIMKSMREQYGSSEGKKVFYASVNKGTIKGVKKLRVGGVGGRAKEGSVERRTGLESQRQSNIRRENFNKMRKKMIQQISPSTKPINRAIGIAAGTVIPGGNLIYKSIVDANSIFAPKRSIFAPKKKTKQVERKVFAPKKKTNQILRNPDDRGNFGGAQPEILPIHLNKKIDEDLIKPKENFFDFVAYNVGGLSGGVKSGPPPRRGPNSQIPPIKMKKGGKL
tara:strand:- start:203 stop:892 length:690 start_codon:yes stop_codon:yes gene_type:complete